MKVRKVKEITYKEHRRASRLFGIKPLMPIKFWFWKHGYIRSYSEKMNEKTE